MKLDVKWDLPSIGLITNQATTNRIAANPVTNWQLSLSRHLTDVRSLVALHPPKSTPGKSVVKDFHIHPDVWNMFMFLIVYIHVDIYILWSA